jgi:hypothetical protein
LIANIASKGITNFINQPKDYMKNKILTTFVLLLSLFIKTNQSYAGSSVGTGIGAELNLPLNFFVEADGFIKYYNNHIVNYNYGLKGDIGYKFLGASVYGLGGVQHTSFSDNQSQNFKDQSSPVYGVGIGYNFPFINTGIRLENTYFSLDRKDGRSDNFNNVDLSLVIVF